MQKDKLLQGIAALAIAALAGGCFQPLYGEESPTGGPVLRDQLLAVEIRNAMLFDFSGGGSAALPTHRLKIAISSTR
jgi:LPS-assembly lipoprotein